MVDILLTVNTPHSPSCRIVPLYPLIYSDRTLTCAYTYTPYTDVTKGDFRHENMQCLLYGSQLGWVEPRLLWVNDESAYEAKFLKNLTEFRKKQHDVFIAAATCASLCLKATTRMSTCLCSAATIW